MIEGMPERDERPWEPCQMKPLGARHGSSLPCVLRAWWSSRTARGQPRQATPWRSCGSWTGAARGGRAVSSSDRFVEAYRLGRNPPGTPPWEPCI